MEEEQTILESHPSDALQPPTDAPEIERGDWLPLPDADPVVEYLVAHHWDQPQAPAGWQVGRLSEAARVYRETATGWSVLAKFYATKTSSAAKYARREFQCTRQARRAGLAEDPIRAHRPLSVWRGVLFLEYVDGLALEDVIAVRRGRPGMLSACLEQTARLLATLHTHGLHPDAPSKFSSSAARARKVIGDLARWGILEEDLIVQEGLHRAIDRWEANPAMSAYIPSLTHGDTTTANFIFPWQGGVVAVDWERLYVADPASDVGLLMAELSHSLTQQGGSIAEAQVFVRLLEEAYRGALPSDWDADVLLERACFYRAWSKLRIARNGWVSRLDRTALVAQALALLAHC